MSVRQLKGPFTVEDYHRLAEVGILGEDDRVELLDGQIVEMTPIGPDHAGCVDDLTRLFSRLAGTSAIVRVQNPVILGQHWEPQPDVTLLRPRPGGYRKAHPGPEDILLVIEVADASLRSDREVKLPLYATAGIPEVWLVDLERDVIEVHRQPGAERYREVRTLGRGDTLAALLVATGTISVDEVLGPRL